MKAIGSESLPLEEKIKRIIEISKYGNTPLVENKNPLTETITHIKQAPDGKLYAIVQERSNYYLKVGLNESTLDYIGGMINKKRNRFDSYADALKKMNLIFKPMIIEAKYKGININEADDDDDNKKYVLAQSKPAVAPVDAMDTPPSPVDDAPMPDETPLPDAQPEADSTEPGLDDQPLPDPGDEGVPSPEDAQPQQTSQAIRLIQKITGKLGQTIREASEEMDDKMIKYVLNSIISAVQIDKLSEADKDSIINKIRPEEDVMREFDIEDQNLPNPEPQHTEEPVYENKSKKFKLIAENVIKNKTQLSKAYKLINEGASITKVNNDSVTFNKGGKSVKLSKRSGIRKK